MKLSHKVSIVSTVSGVLSKTKLVNIESNHFINYLTHLTHLTHNTHLKRTGFTLAEVLITLGIIGVVAAITMPTLIQNHRKTEVETRLKHVYSMMNQAIKLSEVEYGEVTGWDDWQSTNTLDEQIEMFNKYIGKHIKVLDIKKEMHPNGFEYAHVYLSNGSILAFPSWPDYTFYLNEKSLKKPKIGINAFLFAFRPNEKREATIYHDNKGFEPYTLMWDGTEEELYYSDLHGGLGCAKAEAAYCTKIIQINGWKIPKNYPHRF